MGVHVKENVNGNDYYNIYPDRMRKSWTALPLIFKGMKHLLQPIFGLDWARLVEIKMRPQNGPQKVVSTNSDDLQAFLLKEQDCLECLSSVSIIHMEFEFKLYRKDSPFKVLLSHPASVVSDQEIGRPARKIVREYFDHVGFCRKDDALEPDELDVFFDWVSRTESFYMTESDLYNDLGSNLTRELLDLNILQNADASTVFLCPKIKDHKCKQRIKKSVFKDYSRWEYTCPHTPEPKAISEEQITRRFLSQRSFLDFIKKKLKITGPREYSRNKDGVTFLGNTYWRGKNTQVFYLAKLWKPESVSFYRERLGLKRNSLILCPSRWIADARHPNAFDQEGPAEIVFLNKLFEYKEKAIRVSADYSDAIEVTYKSIDLPYAMAVLRDEIKEITKREYLNYLLEAQQGKYGCYLNMRSYNASSLYDCGQIIHGKYFAGELSHSRAAPMASLMINAGEEMELRQLAASISSRFKPCSPCAVQKNIERARQTIDYAHNVRLTERGAKYRRFRIRAGNACFNPPPNEKYLLLLPLDYADRYVVTAAAKRRVV